MDEAVYWAKIGALGQIAGSIATFAAVVVALWLRHAERRISLNVLAATNLIFHGNGTKPEEVMGFNITNAGDRPVTIQSIGWETGWTKRGPNWLRKKYAIQKHDHPLGRHLPTVLDPGCNISILAKGSDVFGKETYRDLFYRNVPFFGSRKTRIRAVVHTTLSTVKVRPSKELIGDLINGRKTDKA